MIFEHQGCIVHSLTEFEIRSLRGGIIRGENIFVICNCGFSENIIIHAKLKTQCGSQRSPIQFPGGYEPLLSDSFPEVLRYDIAREKMRIPVPTKRRWQPGGIGIDMELVPAWIFRLIPRNSAFSDLYEKSELWKSRFALIRQMRKSWADAPHIGSLMAERLDLDWAKCSRASVETGLIDLATRMDQQTCVDLRELLKMMPNELAQAA